MDRPSSLLAVFAFAAALGSSGCKQGAGERCEVDRDCQDGYLCGQKSADSSGGICILPNSIGNIDSGTPADLAAEVASSDLPTDVTSDLLVESAAEAAPEAPDAAAETAPEDAAADSAADAPLDSAADAVTAESGG
ncbi:MAG: hypothetical protein QOI66_338 [Myxococcales bacterium]|jgi:hypothetical protein|nr:hypothetical protein [Myxococcales bacterium]